MSIVDTLGPMAGWPIRQLVLFVAVRVSPSVWYRRLRIIQFAAPGRRVDPRVVGAIYAALALIEKHDVRWLNRLDRLVRDSGIAPRLRDYGIDIAEAPMLAREAMKQTRLLVNNPCEITEADAQRLYEAAW